MMNANRFGSQNNKTHGRENDREHQHQLAPVPIFVADKRRNQPRQQSEPYHKLKDESQTSFFLLRNAPAICPLPPAVWQIAAIGLLSIVNGARSSV